MCLRWHLQLGGAAVAKSVTPGRIEDNYRDDEDLPPGGSGGKMLHSYLTAYCSDPDFLRIFIGAFIYDTYCTYTVLMFLIKEIYSTVVPYVYFFVFNILGFRINLRGSKVLGAGPVRLCSA